MTVDRIERTLDFPFPQERVWRAVTQPEEICRWFSDRVTMTLEAGSDLRMEWDEYGTTTGIVEVVEPNGRFAFRWRAHNVPETEPMTEQNSTLVTYLLTPLENGTRLQVIETGFATLRPGLREKAYRENTSGWAAELSELVTYLDA
ncbi:MAG: SRPBCC domain-containing protein [Chloroflexota bacterium]